nr:hypothetical protein CFP56_08847 [Quercus suber]
MEDTDLKTPILGASQNGRGGGRLSRRSYSVKSLKKEFELRLPDKLRSGELDPESETFGLDHSTISGLTKGTGDPGNPRRKHSPNGHELLSALSTLLLQGRSCPEKLLEIYNFAFGWAKEKGQKSLALDTAIGMWQLLFAEKQWPLVENWSQFLQVAYYPYFDLMRMSGEFL